MKISVTIDGIGARMRRLGEDRAIGSLRTAISERNRWQAAVGDEAAIKPDDGGVEVISVQLER